MKLIDSALRIPLDFQAKTLDEWGIDHAVIAPSDEFVAVYNEEGNDRIAALVKAVPDRFSGLAVANPWYGPRAENILKKAFDQGFCGLYLHPLRQGFRLTEAVVDPLIRICIERDRPIYSHTGTPVVAEPFQLAELARRFPAARFVLGHGAYTDFWYDVVEAMRQAPNIFLESSCQAAPIIQEAVDAVGAERVLFGSGFPRSRPAVELRKIDLMTLTAEARTKILHGNAARLWRITA